MLFKLGETCSYPDIKSEVSSYCKCNIVPCDNNVVTKLFKVKGEERIHKFDKECKWNAHTRQFVALTVSQQQSFTAEHKRLGEIWGREPSHSVFRRRAVYPLGKRTTEISQTVKHRTACDLAIPLERRWNETGRDLCTPIFIEKLFIISRKWNNPYIYLL